MPSLPRLAVPLVISFTLRFLFQTIDLVYATILDDHEAAIAAIGFWTPFQAIFIAIWVGLSAGLTSNLSAAFGRRDEQRIQALLRSMRRILRAAIPILMVAGPGLWLAVPHFGLEPAHTEAFRIYGTTLALGLPLASFWSILPDSIVKAHQDTRSTMLAGLYATGTNVALNTVFVFVFGMGLFGIALATVLSRLIALSYAMHRANVLEADRQGNVQDSAPAVATGENPGGPSRPDSSGRPDHADDSEPWDRNPTRAILILSIPAAAMFVLSATESGVINFVLAAGPDSTRTIASFAAFERMLMLASMPAIGASVAVLPFVSRYLAEGRADEVASNLRAALLFATGLSLLFTVPTGILFPTQITRELLDEDAALASSGAVMILRLLPAAALTPLPFVILRPVFEASGQPRLGVLVSVMRFAILSLPLLFAGSRLAPSMGYDPVVGIVAGMIVATALASIITTWICFTRTLPALIPQSQHR